MGSKKTGTKAAKPALQATASAIDDIFAKPAGKAAPLALQPVASSSKTDPAVSSSGNKSKKKKAKAVASFDPDNDSSGVSIAASVQPGTGATRSVTTAYGKGKGKASATTATEVSAPERTVQVVEDPSMVHIAAQIKAAKAAAAAVPAAGTKAKKRAAADEEDEMFRDSRGTGPRRKTEEGFLIFKEAELNIDPTAGGTPDCPFDCDCCF